jgi:hypothetical protein
MAFVSYTQSASEQPMQFTMNKNDVLTIPKVMADPFFSLEANWYRVGFVFKHTTSNKRFTPSFRNFLSTKRLKIRNGMVDGDVFELKKIILYKSDRTFLVIKTNEIPSVASYMFSLSGSGEETGGGGGETPQPTALVSTENGTIGYANMLNQTRVNDWEVNTGSGWAWGYYGSMNFVIDSVAYSSAGMSLQVYKVRYHFSSLSVTDDSAQFFVTGYSGPVYKTKAQMMLEFTQNGYVDFEYLIPSGTTIQFGAYANTQNSISYNVSKIEIYALDAIVASPVVKWSSSLKHSDLTVSPDGLTVTRNSTAGGYVSAFLDTGYDLSGSNKIYFEMDAVQSSSGYPSYGFVLTQGADPVTFNSGNITMPGGYGVEGPRILMQGSSIYSCGAPYGDSYFKGSLPPGVVTGATLGIAIDVAAKTFFFVVNGVASSVYSFANEVDAGTKLYIGVGPSSSGDSFVKKTSSSNTPTGYTFI